jgi:phage baseplate assembly protein W
MADIDFVRNREYKDLSLTFALNPVTNDVVAVTAEDAVKRSIKNLLLTITGEVPFFPNFGSRIAHLLFEPIDPITTTLLQNELFATIEEFEPRCSIQTLDVIPSDDEHRYDINIVFVLINQAAPVTLSLFLTRLR